MALSRQAGLFFVSRYDIEKRMARHLLLLPQACPLSHAFPQNCQKLDSHLLDKYP